MSESKPFRRHDQAESQRVESLMVSLHDLIRTMTWPFPRLDDVLECLRHVAEQVTGWQGARLVRVVNDGDADPRSSWVLARQARTADGSNASITLQTEDRVVGFIDFPDRYRNGWTERQRVGAALFAQLATSCLTLAEERVRSAAMTDALEYRATHDDLTGLPNRGLVLDRLNHALLTDARRPGVVAVMFVDIDDFKEVNDSLGHAYGDSVLESVARHLSDAVRAGDTVGRLGGDEFLVICENLTGSAGEIQRRLRILARRLQRSVGARANGTETDTAVSVSIGVSIGVGACDPADLIRKADRAMYVAKARGGGRIVLADTVVAPLRRRRPPSPGPAPVDPPASGHPNGQQASSAIAPN